MTNLAAESASHVLIVERYPIFTGLALATLTTAVALLLPPDWALELFASLLAVIGAIYVGFAIAQQKHIVAQFAVALVFMLFGLFGVWLSGWWLIAGYILHGVWDWLHHRHDISIRLTDWYAPFCLVYDWGMAVVIALLFI